MKTKIFLVSLLLSFTASLFAQTGTENDYVSPRSGVNTSFKRNRFGDNWFIHIGGGGAMLVGDFKHNADFMNQLTAAGTFSFGKWISPYFGMRVKGQGGGLHAFRLGSEFMQKDVYVNGHVDFMLNLVNAFGVYSEKKIFNFTPYIGLGYAHRFDNDQEVSPAIASQIPADWARFSDAVTFNGGLMFGFRLGKRVNFDLDLGFAMMPNYFQRYEYTHMIQKKAENYGVMTGTAGFTFKIGKTDFHAIEPMDYALIDDLNNKINRLRAENDELSKRPVSCPDCPKVAPPPAAVEKINYVPNVVFFRLNSSIIDNHQQISVNNTAEFIKKTGEKIKVVGYADRKTGTSAYNLKLSEKRARTVAKELMTKYNIPSEKITIEWKGSDEQPYKENNWNRVVIMSAN